MKKHRNSHYSPRSGKGLSPKSGHYFLYGLHAVTAALSNDERVKGRLYITANHSEKFAAYHDKQAVESVQIEASLVQGAVHQGVMLEVQALPQPSLEEVAAKGKTLLMLDQVTDPHNIGAILRTAAAFDCGAIIVQDKNTPKENATIAKISVGGLESVPMVSVTNLSRTLEELSEEGYWSIGLDGAAKAQLSQIKPNEKTVLVMGAEGRGLRPLVAKHCDSLAKLPIHSQMESLNVSVATGIALYALTHK